MIERYRSDNGLSPAQLLVVFHEGIAALAKKKALSRVVG
jgi:hypothetical protein